MTSTLLDWKRKHGITAEALAGLVTKPVPEFETILTSSFKSI